ncbi:MAG: hypothetical protein O3C69_01250 [Chloroflexi bacterium]|nr:hypothetical protein [Chloroflexota bacterium]
MKASLVNRLPPSGGLRITAGPVSKVSGVLAAIRGFSNRLDTEVTCLFEGPAALMEPAQSHQDTSDRRSG